MPFFPLITNQGTVLTVNWRVSNKNITVGDYEYVFRDNNEGLAESPWGWKFRPWKSDIQNGSRFEDIKRSPREVTANMGGIDLLRSTEYRPVTYMPSLMTEHRANVPN